MLSREKQQVIWRTPVPCGDKYAIEYKPMRRDSRVCLYRTMEADGAGSRKKAARRAARRLPKENGTDCHNRN